MKRFDGAKTALILFGAINLLDAISAFGGHAVDLPPWKFWLYSCWVLIRNTVGYTMLMTAPVYFMGGMSRFLLIPLFGFALLTECATSYAANVFHADLSDAWIQLIENTSLAEIAGFLKMSATLPAVAGVCAFMLVLGGGSMLLWRARYPQASMRSTAKGIAFSAPFLLANCLLIELQCGNWRFGVNQMKYTEFVYKSIKSIADMRGIRLACNQPALPEKLDVEAAAEDMPDGVFVIGESSTRNNWHLYGYQRQTTPRMDALYSAGELVRFDDVAGTQPATAEALSLLLTDVSFDNNRDGNWTLAEAYRRAGYRCILISNQYTWGDTTSTLYALFNGCEKRTSPQIEFGKSGYDEKLVEILENELGKGDARPTIAFVHLSGIHYPVTPERIHPPEDAYFTDKESEEYMRRFAPKTRDRLNRYDDGILYEDKVLDKIVNVLRKRKRPAFMFFVSDHGESPRAETWRSYTDCDVYEVPAVLWMSAKYRSKFCHIAERFGAAAAKRMQQDEMTHGLLELGLIRGVPEKTGKSFLKDDFKGRFPRYINKGKMCYPRDGRR